MSKKVSFYLMIRLASMRCFTPSMSPRNGLQIKTFLRIRTYLLHGKLLHAVSGNNDRYPAHLTEQSPEQALAQRYSPAPDDAAGTRFFCIADLQAVFHLPFT